TGAAGGRPSAILATALNSRAPIAGYSVQAASGGNQTTGAETGLPPERTATRARHATPFSIMTRWPAPSGIRVSGLEEDYRPGPRRPGSVRRRPTDARPLRP